MAEKWVHNLKSAVDIFIKSASNAQIEGAFNRANYELYKTVGSTSFLDDYDFMIEVLEEDE